MLRSLALPPITIDDQCNRAVGVSVIQQAAGALTLLADSLDISFDLAVRAILATRGRVITTGMGKAGHIGRKVAATLSSTGSPAIFVHPGEAAHGDLGVVQNTDSLLVLSNSGATIELLPLLHHVRSLGLPVLAITSQRSSLLATYADITMLLPEVDEACPEGIAPTTSSTMMLALGDALAIATMNARGFSRTELTGLHPGGAIGWRSQPIGRLIRNGSPLPLAALDTPLQDVIAQMTEASKGAAGIVDPNGILIGVITDGDLRRGFDAIPSCSAEQVMTRNPKTVAANVTVGDAAALMAEARITVIFVTDPVLAGRPIGLVHLLDLVMLP
ncbi:KpsF/GutQ family sugar-phosphate isomerase [Sphingomonas sp. JC676]|nr:KpsF/GutQ family sugar-phosphate isomerase [Sphingomonas sp. JC676]